MGTLKTLIFGLGCVVVFVILMPNIHLILLLDLSVKLFSVKLTCELFCLIPNVGLLSCGYVFV